MGAGQIGGIATIHEDTVTEYDAENQSQVAFILEALVDIDFNNAAHFLGVKAEPSEGQFVVSYLSHAMMFCVGALIEAHVVLTPASCVFGERYKFDVFGGTHKFLENSGIPRQVHHLCMHKGYNHSSRWTSCSADNLALLVLDQQFSFNIRQPGADYTINRVRYAVSDDIKNRVGDTTCKFFGWGSRRNGYLFPLLVHLRRMDITIMAADKCLDMWNYKDKYLCIRQPQCRSEKYGALCPDDVGSLITCNGYAIGMMTSRLVDRPCGVGFLDLTQYNKFLTCGVDDSRDVIDHDDNMAVEISQTSLRTLATPKSTPPPTEEEEEEEQEQVKPQSGEEEVEEEEEEVKKEEKKEKKKEEKKEIKKEEKKENNKEEEKEKKKENKDEEDVSDGT